MVYDGEYFRVVLNGEWREVVSDENLRVVTGGEW